MKRTVFILGAAVAVVILLVVGQVGAQKAAVTGQLVESVENRELEGVVDALSRGASPDARDSSGEPVIFLAEARNDDPTVLALADKGAELDGRNELGQTITMRAARRGDLELIRQLLQRRADPNAVDLAGRTALIGAAQGGHLEIMDELLKAGADPNIGDRRGRTPLIHAAARGFAPAVGALLARGARPDHPDTDGRTALSWAAGGGNSDLLRGEVATATMSPIAPVTPRSILPKLPRDHPEVIRLLLDAKAKTESRDLSGRTPLLWAVDAGNGPVVELLLSHGAMGDVVDNAGDGPMKLAARRMDWFTVRSLRARGIVSEPEVELSAAVFAGDLRGVDAAIRRKVDLEARDGRERTPIFWAVEMGKPKILAQLLKAGSDPNAQDRNGETGLLLAARRGDTECTEALLRAGARPDTVDSLYGWTPLMFAAWQGNAELVQQLAAAGARVNRVAPNGGTPLIEAAVHGHEDVVRLLHRLGAPVNQRDVDGGTAYLRAAGAGRREMMALLESLGAVANAKDAAGHDAKWWLASAGRAPRRLRTGNPGAMPSQPAGLPPLTPTGAVFGTQSVPLRGPVGP